MERGLRTTRRLTKEGSVGVLKAGPSTWSRVLCGMLARFRSDAQMPALLYRVP